MKYAIIWLLLALLPISCKGQNGAGKCPPGWEKHPEKYPECAGLESAMFPDPLPVTVTSFSAIVTGQTVVLKWITALEVNHSHYVVQRSADGRTWEDIGQTSGHQFTDYRPETSNYYRLASVDIDQTRHFYRVVFAGFQPVWYTIYTAEGKHLGAVKTLADVPRNQLLIINQKRQIIRI